MPDDFIVIINKAKTTYLRNKDFLYIAQNDNTLIKEYLNWAPDYPLANGMKKTYNWIKEQMVAAKK